MQILSISLIWCNFGTEKWDILLQVLLKSNTNLCFKLCFLIWTKVVEFCEGKEIDVKSFVEVSYANEVVKIFQRRGFLQMYPK